MTTNPAAALPGIAGATPNASEEQGGGSSGVDHPAALEDTPDMVDPEVIEDFAVIGHVEQMTRSACLPAASEPMRSLRPTAAAALSVRAVTTSAGSMPICVQAIAADQRQVLGRAGAGVAVAGQGDRHAALDQPPGRGEVGIPRKKAVPGSSVATVPDAARASMPASVMQSR